MQGRQNDKIICPTRNDQMIIQEKVNGAVIRRYKRGKFLGKGGFAKCYQLTSCQNNKKYAVKLIQKASLTRSKAREKLNSQIKIHKSLKSPYVVGFHHYFEDEDNVYIILELCSNQTLNQLIKRRKRITQIEAKYYMHQIALGIKDIHQNKIIHRDLKLGNLFLTEKLQVKIGDFGLAAKLSFDAERRKTMCGTPNYIAPEILQNQTGHSFEVDIWSLGVIAYAFVVGRPPFQTNDVKMTYSKIKNCNYSFPDSIPLSYTVKKFISKMLTKQPSRRATIDQLLHDDFFMQPFPKTLPISFAACPPNSAFIKQYTEPQGRPSQSKGMSTSRGTLERKESRQQLNTLNTDRLQKQKQRDSLGRVLVRANSIDRVQNKHQVVQRACSTNALMMNKKSSFTKESLSTTPFKNNHGQGPFVWVSYYQQNPKFGVCYLLNSNATGMRFNDSTFIVSNSNFTRVKYFGNLRENPAGESFDIVKTPQTLNKKMKIISHYQKELKNRKQQDESTITNQDRINRQKLRFRETAQTAMTIFVVKHYKTSKVYIFWFNNKDYQVIFKDLTEILVSKQKYVTYVNKASERKYFLINQLAEQSQDIKKRMKHVLVLMMNIKESNAQRNVQNQSNRQNQPPALVRSSSMIKIEKSQPTLTKSSSTVNTLNRLPSYKSFK